jgi:hypothetical protein
MLVGALGTESCIHLLELVVVVHIGRNVEIYLTLYVTSQRLFIGKKKGKVSLCYTFCFFAQYKYLRRFRFRFLPRFDK